MNNRIVESRLFNVLMYVLSILLPTYWTFSNFQKITSTDNAFLAALVVFFGFMAFLYWFLTGDFYKTESPPAEEKNNKKVFRPGGYVYFLQGNGYTKIGKANNISSRTKQLSIKLPFEVELVHYIYSNNPLKLESRLHKKFADKRMNDEWFLLDDGDIKKIKEMGENHG